MPFKGEIMKPVIDVHEHIFRGRDIPLKGYLLSRRYNLLIEILGHLIFFRLIAKCIRRREKRIKKGLLCRLVIGIASFFLGGGYGTWAEILSMNEIPDVASLLLKTFKKDRINLYVPLVIDYEYWFKNTRDAQIANQIHTIAEKIIIPQQGKIHPFVPFDPARELAYRLNLPNPDNIKKGGPPEQCSSLELVKQAIRSKGFIGVKIYNTLGYKPLGNAAVNDLRNKKIFHRNRMGVYTAFSGEQFDQVLTELYEFCVKEQVPITAHCVSDGIEAYPGASYDFGDPVYWKEVLDKFPELHLNLAHFGWNDQERYLKKKCGGKKTWVRKICELLNNYKYLFVDVAHHEVVIPKRRKQLNRDYSAILRDYPGLLQKRLLFGIDWHVISRVENFRDFKCKYIELLIDGNIFSEEEIDDFLGGNALHFLGLLPLGTKAKDGWSKNRQRLADFYKTNHIKPPLWFTSTA
jgi:predicted TIM-barrel fold metal-dependent hydrolase